MKHHHSTYTSAVLVSADTSAVGVLVSADTSAVFVSADTSAVFVSADSSQEEGASISTIADHSNGLKEAATVASNLDAADQTGKAGVEASDKGDGVGHKRPAEARERSPSPTPIVTPSQQQQTGHQQSEEGGGRNETPKENNNTSVNKIEKKMVVAGKKGQAPTLRRFVHFAQIAARAATSKVMCAIAAQVPQLRGPETFRHLYLVAPLVLVMVLVMIQLDIQGALTDHQDHLPLTTATAGPRWKDVHHNADCHDLDRAFISNFGLLRQPPNTVSNESSTPPGQVYTLMSSDCHANDATVPTPAASVSKSEGSDSKDGTTTINKNKETKRDGPTPPPDRDNDHGVSSHRLHSRPWIVFASASASTKKQIERQGGIATFPEEAANAAARRVFLFLLSICIVVMLQLFVIDGMYGGTSLLCSLLVDMLQNDHYCPDSFECPSDLLPSALECSCCLSLLHLPLRVVTCGHNFCSRCILGWIKSRVNENVTPCCPKCQTPIVTTQNALPQVHIDVGNRYGKCSGHVGWFHVSQCTWIGRKKDHVHHMQTVAHGRKSTAPFLLMCLIALLVGVWCSLNTSNGPLLGWFLNCMFILATFNATLRLADLWSPLGFALVALLGIFGRMEGFFWFEILLRLLSVNAHPRGPVVPTTLTSGSGSTILQWGSNALLTSVIASINSAVLLSMGWQVHGYSTGGTATAVLLSVCAAVVTMPWLHSIADQLFERRRVKAAVVIFVLLPLTFVWTFVVAELNNESLAVKVDTFADLQPLHSAAPNLSFAATTLASQRTIRPTIVQMENRLTLCAYQADYSRLHTTIVQLFITSATTAHTASTINQNEAPSFAPKPLSEAPWFERALYRIFPSIGQYWYYHDSDYNSSSGHTATSTITKQNTTRETCPASSSAATTTWADLSADSPRIVFFVLTGMSGLLAILRALFLGIDPTARGPGVLNLLFYVIFPELTLLEFFVFIVVMYLYFVKQCRALGFRAIIKSMGLFIWTSVKVAIRHYWNQRHAVMWGAFRVTLLLLHLIGMGLGGAE